MRSWNDRLKDIMPTPARRAEVGRRGAGRHLGRPHHMADEGPRRRQSQPARTRPELHFRRDGRLHQPDGMLGFEGDRSDAERSRCPEDSVGPVSLQNAVSELMTAITWNKVALVRSMRASELIHFNGQYHTQTGRSLNPAIAKEIPGVRIGDCRRARREAARYRPVPDIRQHRHDPSERRLDWRRPVPGAVHRAGSRSHHDFRGVRRQHRRRRTACSTSGGKCWATLPQASAAERASIGTVTSDYHGLLQGSLRPAERRALDAVFKASEEDKKRYGGATTIRDGPDTGAKSDRRRCRHPLRLRQRRRPDGITTATSSTAASRAITTSAAPGSTKA